MDIPRIIATVVFVGSLVLLGDAWLKQNQDTSPDVTTQPTISESASTLPTASSGETISKSEDTMLPVVTGASAKSDLVTVETDLFIAKIATNGGGLKELVLKEHHVKGNKNESLRLFELNPLRTYTAEAGLLGLNLPNHNTKFIATKSEYLLDAGQNTLQVSLIADTGNAKVTKTYTFRRGLYAIDVAFGLVNRSEEALDADAYFQIIRDGGAAEGDTKFQPTYTGGAVYTDESKFTKVDFKDMDRGKVKYPKIANDGWVAFVQHYFVAAWLPESAAQREYFTRSLGNNLYAMGYVQKLGSVQPGELRNVSTRLYAGPQEQDKLKVLSPGLELVVDYGWLTILASPLFWLLSTLHGFIGNWGWSIVLLTLIIKLIFFPLSAAGYKSMAKMRVLSPRLQQLKESYGDDKQKFQQAMMELYKTEKINPLGGCMPILVQIPFFIALYWVLLASVELRDAPFIFWITDLSAKDPYYVLPVLMALSMVAQSWLSPAPPDPVQAKVMKIMPVVFSIFFFFFASGLVLYWLVNNVLSIAQQWTITRAIEGGKPGNAKR